MITPSTVTANLSIGLLTWWELNDTKIAPAALRAILADEGLDAAGVPDIDQPAAVRRAARGWTQGRGNADRYRAEVVFDHASATGGRIEVGVLQRRRLSDHEVEWVQVDVVAYDVDSAGNAIRDRWVGNGTAEADSVAEDVTSTCTFLDHEWIRPNLVAARLSAMGALPVRKSGGVAFVPRCYEPELRRLQAVVRRIGSSEFEAAAIDPNDATTRATIERRAGDNLAEALNDFGKRLAEWEGATRTVPSHAVSSILADFAEINERGELYALALGVTLDGLREKLDAAKDRARALLAGGDSVAA
jgi:hypothetical protein